MTALTVDPRFDTFPRFSPDGSQIVFNRSRDPRASSRQPRAFDVWIMKTDGTDQHLLARSGFHPSFTADGRFVIFSRGDAIVRRSIATGAATCTVSATLPMR